MCYWPCQLLRASQMATCTEKPKATQKHHGSWYVVFFKEGIKGEKKGRRKRNIEWVYKNEAKWGSMHSRCNCNVYGLVQTGENKQAGMHLQNRLLP